MFLIREFLREEILNDLISLYEQRAIESQDLFADTIHHFRNYINQSEKILNHSITDRDLINIPKKYRAKFI